MSALKQYIDLYREHKGLIDANSCDPMNILRAKAANVIENMALPKAGSENYETVDLEKILAPDFGVNVARVPLDVNPALSFRCNVPAISTILFTLENDSFSVLDNSADRLPEGVTVASLRTFGLDYPEILEKYYGKAADIANPIVALDSLLAQDGVIIYVKRGVKADKPIQIVNALQHGQPLLAPRRVLIVLEEMAEATVLFCDHTQNTAVDFLALSTVEIFADKGSRLDFYELEESSEKTARLSAVYSRQEADSHLLIDSITLFNGLTRNEYYNKLLGEGASLRLYGMGIEDCSRSLSTYSKIEHAAPHCNSDELFKYVVDEEASGAFAGLIYVDPGAVKTEAYQSNRNLVGNDTASMFSKPQLEIYNDDVKCSHGTATGQLDEMQLFYMRTRGLSPATAKLLLKQAFMADVIDAVTLQPLKDRLHTLVERRFSGEMSGCGACGACDSHSQLE